MTRTSLLKFFVPLLLLIVIIAMIPRQDKKQDVGLTVEEYFKKVNIKDTAVFVYFYADWCVPCVKLKPVMGELEKEYTGKIKFLKLDVDDNPAISLHFEINTLPLFFIYKNSKKVWTNNTYMNKQDLSARLDFYK
jgi:thioredoxin